MRPQRWWRRIKNNEDAQRMYSEQCGAYRVWSGIGHLCQTLRIWGPTGGESGSRGKFEIKGLVKDWSMREMTGIRNEQVVQLLNQLEGTPPKELKYLCGLDVLKRQSGYMVEEDHGLFVVHDDNAVNILCPGER